MNKPQLSVIVMCGQRQGMLERFIHSFISTQPLEKLEIIFFLPQDFNPPIPDHLFAFPVKKVTYTQTNYFTILSEAVHQAEADYIVFQENHTEVKVNVVDPLLRIMRSGNYSSLGCVICPGENNSYTDWTAYLCHYLGWGPKHPIGPTQQIMPGHNSAWKTSVLLDLEEELPLYLMAETILYWKLAKKGHQFYFTDEFYLIHDDKMRFTELLSESFWFGWIFAYTRWHVDRWSLAKRIIYAAAIYIKPLIRFWQVGKLIMQQKFIAKSKILFYLPAIFLTLVINAAGESMGVLFEVETAIRHYSREH